MSLTTLIIILLIVILAGGIGYRRMGSVSLGPIGLVLIILGILYITGHINL